MAWSDVLFCGPTNCGGGRGDDLSGLCISTSSRKDRAVRDDFAGQHHFWLDTQLKSERDSAWVDQYSNLGGPPELRFLAQP